MRRILPAFILFVPILIASQLQAKSPIPVEQVATMELITAELESQLENVSDLLEDPEDFDENQEKIEQAGRDCVCITSVD